MKRILWSLGLAFFLLSGVVEAQSIHYEPYRWSTLAGNATGGSTDGQGSAARFNYPKGVAVDSGGNIFVADSSNNAIRKITPGGLVSTVAGPGTNIDNLTLPYGVAVDGAGNIYVADTYNSVIRKITPNGTSTIFAGEEDSPGSADGNGRDARFNLPLRLAVDSMGNLYVADLGNYTVRKITPDGAVTTLAGKAGSRGSADGTGSDARFEGPNSIAVDGMGNVYVTELSYAVRKITPAGVVSTLAGSPDIAGYVDGVGSDARFSNLEGVTVDSAGYVYVSDAGNITIRKISPGGMVTTLAGSAGSFGSGDGAGSAARFAGPSGMAVDSSGNIYVADTNYFYFAPDSTNNTIRKVTPAGVVTTLAGLPGGAGSRDGVGAAARFNGPWGVAVSKAHDVYVADTTNNTIRKITPAGQVTTFTGAVGIAGSNNGVGTAARFWLPSGIAVDQAENLYVADTGNNVIRKITPDGMVTTLAGGFSAPRGVAVDNAGNVFVADSGNYTVRQITPDGLVSTLAGMAGSPGSADGTGAAARFDFRRPEPAVPFPVVLSVGDVGVDGAGNVYVADTGNHTIRRITPAGVVTTVAGAAGQNGNIDAPGTAARFTYPEGIVADQAGNLYVTSHAVDLVNSSSVRKVTSAGIVTTLSSLGGGYADGVGSVARFGSPEGIAVDNEGTLYVADTNHTIRLGVPPAPSHFLNIATRLRVDLGDNALIGGFIVTGTAPKKVIIRAIGPSLANSGLLQVLPDPVLELYDSHGVLLAKNDDWKDNQAVEIQQSGVPPQNNLESAIVATLTPNQGYTAVIRGKDNATGIAVFEAYDISQQTDGVLGNISTRGFVAAGSNVMIGGFIVGGGGAGSSRVLMRALGPSLSQSGVQNPLLDPTLELHDGNGALVISNDNWKDTQQGEIEETHIPPSNDSESAIIATLPSGNYTAIMTGKGAGTGVGLIEAYNLP